MGQTFRCPKCGATYAMKPEYAGKQVKCKKCECKFAIPAPVPAPAPPINNMAELLDEIPLASVRPNSTVAQPQAGPMRPLRQPTTPEKSWAERNPVVMKVAVPMVLMAVLGLVLPRFGLQLRKINRLQEQSARNEHLQDPETMTLGLCITLGVVGGLIAGFALRKQPQMALLAVVGSLSALGAAFVVCPYSGFFPTRALEIARSNNQEDSLKGNGSAQPPDVRGTNDPRLYEQILAALKSDDRLQYRSAARQLAGTKPTYFRTEIAATLESRLDDSDPEVRSSCLIALNTWSDGDPVPALIRAIDDKHPAVFATALTLLMSRKDPRAIGPITALVTGPNATVASSYLRQIGPACESEVLKYIDNPDPVVRRRVVDLLGSVAAEKGVAKLRELVNDADVTIRSEATAALARHGISVPMATGTPRKTASSPTMNRTNSSPREDFDNRHSTPTEDVSPGNFDRLARQLQSHNLIERSKAIDALLAANPEDASGEARQAIIAAFRAALPTWIGDAQRKAVLGLARWAGKDAVPDLLPLLADHNPHLRAAVLQALGALEDARAAVAVAQRLGDFFDHEKAVACLRQMGAASEDGLLEAVNSQNPKVCSAAIALLAEVGTEKSLPTLRKLARNRMPAVSTAAKTAIKRIAERKAKPGSDSEG